MSPDNVRVVSGYQVRRARPEDVDGARSVMLDTFYRVLGHGYVPKWHADVISLEATYFHTPGNALFVAAAGEKIVGTASVRADGPNSPPHPEWIAESYPSGSTAQLFRTYVRPEHRRHGLARSLVEMACRFVAETPEYQRIYLHTNPSIEGAEPFWRSMAKEMYDGRHDSSYSPCIHFEIPVPRV